MIRKPLFLALLFVAVAIPVFGGPQVAAKKTVMTSNHWLDPAARYRLRVRPEKPGEASCVDLRRMLLPVLPEKGVEVFDDRGKPVAFRLYENGMLAIAPTAEAKYFDLYFGFEKTRQMDGWGTESGPCPPSERLRLQIFRGNRPCTSEEFLPWKNAGIERRNSWRVRSFYMRPFQILAERYWGMEPFPWAPRFSQYRENRRKLWDRLHTKSSWMWIAAAIRLGELPQIRRMESFNHSWQYQFRDQLISIGRDQTRIAKEYAQARKDMEHGAENDLLDIDKLRHPHIFPATELQLLVRPPETWEFYSARFSGCLEIPADGEYEFELFSNSLTFLQLDGKTVLDRTGVNGSQPATRQVVKVRLKKGSVPFKLLFRASHGHGLLTVRMRRAGEGEFRLLTAADDFLPAPAAVPEELVSRDNRSYPLMMRRGRYLMYTAKQDWLPIESFRFLTPAAKLEWSVDGFKYQSVDRLPPTVVVGKGPKERLRFRYAGRPETELPVLCSDVRTGQVPLPPDLSLRLWTPVVIYEDETLPVTMEVSSRLPLPMDVALNIAWGEGKTDRRILHMPGKADERFHHAAADVYRKETVELSPDELKGKQQATFDAGVNAGGFEFDRKRLTIVRVSSDADFEALAKAGDVTLVLHRPDLSDVRAWELLRTIEKELQTRQKVLVIGESAEGVETLARKRLQSKDQELEFVAWDDSERPLETSLFRLLDRIGKSDADRAVLILPVLRRLGTLEPWRRDRCLAALLEKLKGNSNLHEIYLLSGIFRPGAEKEEAELLDALRRQCREYDVKLLEPSGPGSPPTGTDRRTYSKSDFAEQWNRVETYL